MKTAFPACLLSLTAALCLNAAADREYHVAVTGNDTNDGSAAAPLRTISAAAALAQPGDTVTVHEGVYREWVNPPRGGESDAKRITYQAAPGEKVAVKGSEVVTGWEKVQNDTWKVTVPNSLFGDYNPYADLIRGDWFSPKDREHHTGAVYLDGEWLIEAATLDEALAPAGTVPAWLQQAGLDYLLNVAWLQPKGGDKIPVTAFTAKNGTQNAPCSEGGECVGFIQHGHWLKYEGVDFGKGTSVLDIRAASASSGGIIELRLDAPDGALIGTRPVPNTGEWQDWRTFKADITPQEGKKTVFLVFKSKSARPVEQEPRLWKAQVDADTTTIWAQFTDVNPNERLTEINVRRAVFYPMETGRNYLTVRGFTLCQAATQWAPPTAEQIAIIGTNWSKGWVIENNTISHSVCCGVALGKHGDEFDNTSADTAEGYVKTIERATARGWSGENIGHHIVRDNHISHCEQTGIVGSLGAVFSTITNNHIHDIHIRALFTGAEMAGIKLHGAIDVVIKDNRIHRNGSFGIWLDWMAQGARVTSNLLYDNPIDLFMEVDHGPFVVDNNVFLSGTSLLDVSRGGAYAHNLFTGDFRMHEYDARLTPFHKAHSTEVAGLHDNPAGDDRFLNNLLTGRASLRVYDKARLPMFIEDNVHLDGARPAKAEKNPLVVKDFDPAFRLVEKDSAVWLEGKMDAAWAKENARKPVTTERLGKAVVPDLPYENRDGSPLTVDTDHFGAKRNLDNPFPGPFELPQGGDLSVKVWPKQ